MNIKKSSYISEAFDSDFYYATYPDVRKMGMDAWQHYQKFGKKEGRSPNKNKHEQFQDIALIRESPYFDEIWYKNAYSDINWNNIDAFTHYYTIGWKKGCIPSLLFDTNSYLDMYPDVAQKEINPLIHYILYGKSENRQVLKYDKNSQERIVKSREHYEHLSFQKEYPENICKAHHHRIAIFASYNSNFCIDEYVLWYLQELKKIVDYIIFVTDNYTPYSEIEKIKKLIIWCRCEYHGEYDFGSYKYGYIYALQHGLLKNTEELILCNDSCYGPLYSFNKLWEYMSSKKCDFWGITNNIQYTEHLQSYFLVFKKNVFLHNEFKYFLYSINKKSSVSEVILDYETQFTNILKQHGFIYKALIDYHEIELKSNENVLKYPISLLEKKSPFLKRKAINQPHTNNQGIGPLLNYLKHNYINYYNLIAKDSEQYKILTDGRKNISYSIVMPTYNRRHTLKKTIDTILIQTHPYFELIIIDDASTDYTDFFIQTEYKKELTERKIIYHKFINNMGASYARNFGLSLAKNKWICYVDSDNKITPSFLDIFTDAILNNQENKIFYAQVRQFPQDIIIGKKFDYDTLLKGNYIDLGVFIHHIDLYNKLGGFDTKLRRLIDYDLILTYTKFYTPVFIPIPLLEYNNDEEDSSRISVRENFVIANQYIQKKHKGSIKISTIITSYNHERYIDKALESAIMQYGDFLHEIIISDDGSTDNTPKIIEYYEKKYPTLIINLSNTENIGISNNMRKCFAQATGDYITILEGDDFWTHPIKNYKQIKFLEDNRDCSMVFSAAFIYKEEDLMIIEPERQKKLKNKLNGSDLLQGEGNPMVTFSSCCFKAPLLKNLPSDIFTERLSEIALAFYLENYGNIGFISEKHLIYRQHSGSVWTGSNKVEQLRQSIITRKTALKFCRKKYASALIKCINLKEEEYEKYISYNCTD